jgi:hypothetical protein
MTKKLLLFATALFMCTALFSQATLYTTAPNGVTTTQVRAPNGLSTYAYHRACLLVLGSELASIAPGSTLTTFGYTLSAGTNTSTVGNFTVYLQNTSDVTYTKGTTWSSIITGMTSVYASTMTLPASAGTTSVTLTLSTPFVYTGGGIYVATDWYSAGPYATTPATYYADGTTLVPGCASANSAASAPTTLGTTAFRPNILFGRANPYSNEVSVTGIEAPGKVAGMFNTGHTVKAIIRNNSNQTLTNIPVTLNVTGANSFTNTQVVSSLAAGVSTTVSFASFNPTLAGLNTLSVSVPNDDVNSNNSATYSQSVTCNQWAMNPATGTYTGAVGFNTGSGIIAVNYPNTSASSLTGINVGISTGTTSVGNSVWATLLSSTGNTIATTNTVSITNGMLGTTQTFTFAAPQNLSASTDYYLGLAQSANTTTGYFPIAAYPLPYVPYLNYVTTTTIGGTPAPLTANLGYFDIGAVFAAPTITVNSGAVCAGNAFTITANGANTYSYSSGSNVVTPTSDATYTVTGYGNGGCVNTAVSTVSVNALPNVTASSGSICTGNSYTIVAGGATSYTYSGGSDVVSPTADNTYTVSGTDANGCVNSAVSSVTVNALPSVTANNGTICAGNSFTIVANGASTYTYSGGSDIVSPTADATYTVTGADANGCVSSAVSSVTVNALPSVTANNGTICAGNSFTIVANGASTYTYSGGSDIVSPTSDATYTVTGTDANGCENMAISSVTVNALPNLTASTNNTLLCVGETATLSVGGASTYTWSTGENTMDIAVSPSLQTTYTVSGTDVNGCENTTTIQQDVDLCTAVAKLNTKDVSITVYPNPNNGLFFLDLNTSSDIWVLNALGESVYNLKSVSGNHNVDLQHQPNGVYFVKVIQNNKQYIVKVIKE